MNKKLRKLRYENGYTTKDMAEKLNISKAFYFQVDNKICISYNSITTFGGYYGWS